MKSKYQTLTFLSQFQPSSELDNDIITAFLEKRYNITPTTIVFATGADFSPIDAQTFTKWFENGYAASDVVKHNNRLAILGVCNVESANIIGYVENGTVNTTNYSVNIEELESSTDEDTSAFLQSLLSNNLQFNPINLCLEEKYIPENNERVAFHNLNQSMSGVGVVRDIDMETLEVELYCYFIYPTKTTKARVGYSMHELGIVNLRDHIFEPLTDDNDKRFSNESGISGYRRLQRELGKVGKVWKDKLRRVEPADFKVPLGQKYWYINDKLKIIQETEKGTPTSQMRYICGNYFVTHEAATRMVGKVNEIVRDYLASAEWPNGIDV